MLCGFSAAEHSTETLFFLPVPLPFFTTHFTQDNLKKLGLKKKIRQNRRPRGAQSVSNAIPISLVHIVGTLLSSDDNFLFIIGGNCIPSVLLPPEFRYDILFRPLGEWSERDRMYDDEMELLKLTADELSALISNHTQEVEESIQNPQSRGRLNRNIDKYFGFRWVRKKEQNIKSLTFHTVDASDVHGDLFFNVPSAVFFGTLYEPEISKLLEGNTDLFST